MLVGSGFEVRGPSSAAVRVVDLDWSFVLGWGAAGSGFGRGARSDWGSVEFVIVSASGWGLLFFGAYKFFTKGGKKEEQCFPNHERFFREVQKWWKHHNKGSSFDVADLFDNNVSIGLDMPEKFIFLLAKTTLMVNLGSLQYYRLTWRSI
ncbi:hypothetical protein TIFTF001_026289 [Ficus carica]|uniref:Uncharacterized protein n=1 Tax=Ficus carica TaxID=3494 RepID=A0AA88DL03_FICCA|nr:hypothetical protein TIFTF001_026289 [Ficus carica]